MIMRTRLYDVRALHPGEENALVFFSNVLWCPGIFVDFCHCQLPLSVCSEHNEYHFLTLYF